MDWLLELDRSLFRFGNQALAHPVTDWLMPFLSGNPFFFPAVALLAGYLVWRGGVRGRLVVALVVLLVGLVNNLLVVDFLKDFFARPRPFSDLPDARVLVGRGGSFSMPSGHAANWFAGVALAWIYYRRSLWVVAPLAVLVSGSRIYNGVHYPSDVVAGAIVGLAVGGGGAWLLDAAWRTAGRRLFPLWWRHLPSLLRPVYHPDPLSPRPGIEGVRDPRAAGERQWLHLGYVLTAVLLGARLLYLASDKIELSKDEAYQWLWSKHLALSYYSKPPMIAWLQWLGTHLWGDTELGVRCLSPVITAVLSLLLLRFFAREVNARAGFWLLLILTAAPLVSVGSILMTIDPPLVLCWGAAMMAGWRACKPGGRTRDWAWVGLWLGLGFLSKYAALLQWLSFALFLVLWPTARVHWRRPGPYVALLINLLCTLPVLIWNAQRDWITVTHLHDRAGLAAAWRPTPNFLIDFTAAQFALLNPVFFVGMLWAVVAVLRHRRNQALFMYLLAMGAPLYFGYWLYTLRARVHPNWIAPAVVPLFCLMVAYADARWRGGLRAVRGWLVAGLALGLTAVTLFHDSNLIGKLVGRALPGEKDPLRRVRAWRATAEVVNRARLDLAAEGKPVFIISHHYGMAGQFSFYLPEARATAASAEPLVYSVSTSKPENQFYFWPGYRGRRTGQNAILAVEYDPPPLVKDWPWRWLRGETDLRASEDLPPPELPPVIVEEFESVTDLGLHEVEYRGRVFRRLRLFACRTLRE